LVKFLMVNHAQLQFTQFVLIMISNYYSFTQIILYIYEMYIILIK